MRVDIEEETKLEALIKDITAEWPSGLIPRIIYFLAYLNALLYCGYYLLFLSGVADWPLKWDLNKDGGPLMLGFGCILLSSLSLALLYIIPRFDFMRMTYGTSLPSRIFLYTLSLIYSYTLLYAFYINFLAGFST